MYCKNCGYKNTDDAKFCESCGSKLISENGVIEQTETTYSNSQPIEIKEERKYSGKAITGFVLSLVGMVFAGLICGVLGTIFSSISLVEIPKKQFNGKGLAIAGLVVSIVDIVLMIIFYAMGISMFTGF